MASFVPALIVVDMQEDFCPPTGSLPIPSGRAIAAPINSLLTLPFILKIGTQDWHPATSKTFASAHPSRNLQPYTSTYTGANPDDPTHTETWQVWPDHCVQGTPGAELIPELDGERLDVVVRKGLDAEAEAFSGFADCFGRRGRSSFSGVGGAGAGAGARARTGSGDGRIGDENGSGKDGERDEGMDLGKMLQDRGVTDVFVTGLAFTGCVKATALHSKLLFGFKTYVVSECSRPLEGERAEGARRELLEAGVEIISTQGPELARVRNLR